jgi:hypothetical protein
MMENHLQPNPKEARMKTNGSMPRSFHTIGKVGIGKSAPWAILNVNSASLKRCRAKGRKGIYRYGSWISRAKPSKNYAADILKIRIRMLEAELKRVLTEGKKEAGRAR